MKGRKYTQISMIAAEDTLSPFWLRFPYRVCMAFITIVKNPVQCILKKKKKSFKGKTPFKVPTSLVAESIIKHNTLVTI